MVARKRLFILGAGFSKPAGMPLATELLPLLLEEIRVDEMRDWLAHFGKRLKWLCNNNPQGGSFTLNIEEVFHYAHFDIEDFRLQQHLSRVRRQDGSGTAWTQAEQIGHWLSLLEYALRDVIFNKDDHSNLEPIVRWAKIVDNLDIVLTFNYDTLVERALTEVGKAWNHGTGRVDDGGVAVCKMHGSIDWIVAHRLESRSKLDLLFDKENANRSQQDTGWVEDDYRLWRCRSRDQLRKWIADRDLQSVPHGASPKDVGIAGLGAYKQLHQIPGLGRVWSHAMNALYEADSAIIVGFAMSDFDAMAQMQFANVAMKRAEASRPLPVTVIDPCLSDAGKDRFRRVFRCVDFVNNGHETVNWHEL